MNWRSHKAYLERRRKRELRKLIAQQNKDMKQGHRYVISSGVKE